MTAAIHVNSAEAMRSTGLKDDELLKIGKMDKLSPVRGRNLSKTSGGFTARIRFKLVVLAIVVDGASPRLKWNLTQRGFSWIVVLRAARRGSGRQGVRNCERAS